jgi:hypothetical protein
MSTAVRARGTARVNRILSAHDGTVLMPPTGRRRDFGVSYAKHAIQVVSCMGCVLSDAVAG